MQLNKEEEAKLKRFKEDFIFRAKNLYQITNSKGELVPFELNSAQLYLHNRLEEIKKKKGYIRAIIVKGRQQGITTYTTCRFLDNIIFNSNITAKLAAHSQKNVEELYKIVKRYYDNLPPYFKLKKIVDNISNMTLENKSEYSIVTASRPDIFRGNTLQLVHLSEVSSYDPKIAPELMAGLIPAVHRVDGTEIIVESTAKGKDNVYYDYYRQAISGKGEYELIFIPWYWQDEYREKDTSNLQMSEADKLYQKRFKLDDEQMMWRQITTESFRLDENRTGVSAEDKFRHEYPANPEEAFSTSSVVRFFDPVKVQKAMINHVDKQHNKVIVGLDVAGSGNDRTVFSFRKGRHHFKTEIYKGWDSNQIIARAIEIIKQYKCYIIIDKGYNPGVFDVLMNSGWNEYIFGVHFGQNADNPNKYKNKRAEMYDRLREWLDDELVQIEDDEELETELLAIDRKPPDANGRLCLKSKEEIKEVLKVSPDKADALALTFGYMLNTYEDFEDFEEEENYIQRGDSVTGY